MKSGSQQLKAWMDRLRLTYRAAADILGVNWAYLNQIVNEKRSPSFAMASRIQHETGIPVGAWVPTRVDSKKRSTKRGHKSAA